MKNINYKSENIKKYFSTERVIWEEFYPSERKVIQDTITRFDSIDNIEVLDIGCACGGLGNALNKKFNISNYTGVEINKQAAEYGEILNNDLKIMQGDFLEITNKIKENHFDLVFSLSCIDWQNNFQLMLEESWKKVKSGGYFIASFRITDQKSVNNIKSSYQYINYEKKRSGEIAPYVIFNLNDLLKSIIKLNAENIYGYGYAGVPSSTAICPYDKLCFSVLAVQKPYLDKKEHPRIDLDFPRQFLECIKI